MKTNTLILLGVVALLMVGLSYLSYANRSNSLRAERASGYFIPELNIEAVGRIEIQKDQDLLVFRKDSDGFVLESHNDYPVNHTKILDLLRDCGTIEIDHLITSNSNNHASLGVAEVGAVSPESIRVSIFNEVREPIQEFILGHSATNGSGYYIRKLKEDAVHDSKDTIFITTKALDYVNTTLIEIFRSSINSIQVSGTHTYTVQRDQVDNSLSLVDMADDLKKVEGEIAPMFNALGSLAMKGFSPYDDPDLADLEWTEHLHYITKDEAIYDVHIATRDNQHYVKLSATWTMTDIPLESDATPERMKEIEGLQERANTFNKQNRLFKSWIYEIPEYKFNQFVKPLDLITSKKEQPNVGPELPDDGSDDPDNVPDDSEKKDQQPNDESSPPDDNTPPPDEEDGTDETDNVEDDSR